jgi:hypothetical protein
MERYITALETDRVTAGVQVENWEAACDRLPGGASMTLQPSTRAGCALTPFPALVDVCAHSSVPVLCQPVPPAR